MKIVVDTNVLISGVFFGGWPGIVLRSVVSKTITACATEEIIREYYEIVHEMISRKQGHLNPDFLVPLVKAMEIVESHSVVSECRDPDDNKFLSCAKDAKAIYIVSGDNDLLVLNKFENVEIITAKDFCERFNLIPRCER